MKSLFGFKAIALFVICVGLMQAMPPRPGLELPPEDYEEMARLGINISKNPIRDAGKRDIYNTPGDVQPLVTGTKQFPVVCIQYPDYASVYTVADFQNMLFSDAWASGSAKKYYNEVSYGMFTLAGQVFGWYTAANIKSYYGYSNGSARAAALAKEAATQADATVNYALYDNDGDGYVDCFTCVHSGYGREETGSGTDIHSHSWDFTSAGIGEYTTNDPRPGFPGQFIKINEYVIDPERSNYSNYGTMVAIGVFVHEWGHALSLPDLYDTDGGSIGLGYWCLMAGGSWGANGNSPWYPAHLCAWAKMELGWLSPTAVRGRKLYSIPQIETNSKAYWLIGRQRTFREYFLIENRRKTLFDTLMMGQGLLIYHIDDSVIARRRGFNAINNGGAYWRYGVALEQADGLDHLFNNNNSGDAADPFPGSTNNQTFDSTATTPNSRTNYPIASTLITSSFVKNIPASASVMSCTLSSGVVGAYTSSADAAGYSWIDSDTSGGPVYNWIDISPFGTSLGTGDDQLYWFRLPYNFNFYGVSYDTVWVSTNGWISFGINPGTNAPSNVSIPAVAAPNRAVYVFWDDLNLVASDNANIYYQTLGTTPNRYTVITWKDARHKNAPPGNLKPANQVTFQVILHENGKIITQYKDCAVGDSLYNWGRSATIGIENAGGTVGRQYLFNGSPVGNLVASERAIQFSCKDVGVISIDTPNGTVDSTGLIIPRATIKNFSSGTEIVSVTFRISSGYTSTRNKTLGAGQQDTVNFTAWQPVRGAFTAKCSTYLLNDGVKINDTLTVPFTVQVRNVGVLAIENPVGTFDSTGPIVPRALVRNYGSEVETFNVKFRIGSVYSQTRSKTLSPGVQDTVLFPSWTPVRGTYQIRCSTMLAGDIQYSNDTMSNSITVQVKDVGITQIITPSGVIDSSGPITPQVRVKNYGTSQAVFNVWLRIGSGYNVNRAKTINAGFEDTVNFTAWQPMRGAHAVRCSVNLTSDAVRTNDTLSGSVTVRVKDIALLAIEYPTGTIDSGLPIIPRALVRNNSSNNETFNITFIIGTNYTHTRTKTLNTGQEDTVNFAQWSGMRGSYATRCSVYLAGDVAPSNDTLSGSFNLIVRDVGVVSITVPADTINRGLLSPRATVRNYGSLRESFYTYCKIYNQSGALVYIDSSFVNNLNINTSSTRTFKEFVFLTGIYTIRCSTALVGDANPSNNLMTKVAVVRYQPPWAMRESVPRGPSGKAVKGGGALTSGGGEIYLLKGNNTREFFVYDIDDDTWALIESIPFDTLRAKKVNKGAVLAYNNHATPDIIYATKGNNTLEFWAYNVETDTWVQKPDVPVSYPIKKVKAGAAMAYLRRGSNQYIYLLKGGGTLEFYGYHCQGDSWIKNLQFPPSGPNVKGYKDGSCMTVGYNGYIYLLKGGAPTNEFYCYKPADDTWLTLELLPIYSSLTRRYTKVRTGASLCYDGDSLLYAFKGGNRQEFWQYNAIRNSWRELDTMPRYPSGKKISSGGSMVCVNDLIYAIKGNKTYEFWTYTPGISDIPSETFNVNNQISNIQTENLQSQIPNSKFWMTVTPNPISKKSIMKFNVPLTEKLRIGLYNSTGQLITTFYNGEINQGTYSLPVSSEDLSTGIYILKSQIGKRTYQIKLIVN